MTLWTRISLSFGKNPLRFCIDMFFVVALLVNFVCFAMTFIDWKLFLGFIALAFIYSKFIRSAVGWQ